MTPEASERPHSRIKTGDVQGVGIVIGDGSSVNVGQSLPLAQREVIETLDEFLDLLDSCTGSVPDALDVRQSAQAAKAEAEESSPRWGIVRGLLKGIAASVAGVASLTDAIRNVQDLIAHISR